MANVCRQCGRRNADGVQFCTNPDCGAYLGWEGRDLFLPVTGRAGATPGGQAGTGGTPAAGPPTGAQSAAAAVTLAETNLAVDPGDTVATTATVYNGGSQVEQFTMAVLGPAAAWATVDPVSLRIFPGASAECSVRLAPPRVAETPAGRVWVAVRASSTLHPGLVAGADATLDVAAFREVTAVLVPQQTSGRGRTTHRVDVTNAGNVVEPVRIEASDATGKIRFGVPAGELPLRTGKHPVTVSVRPPGRWLGGAQQAPFTVTVTPRPPLPPVRLDGTREIVPLIAGWVPKVALAAAGLALAAAALFLIPGSPLRPNKAGEVSAAPGASGESALPLPATEGTKGGASEKPAASRGAASSAPPALVAAPAQAVVVAANGTVVRRVGLNNASVAGTGTGEWEVTFPVDMRGCSYVATVGDPANQPVPGAGLASTARGRGNNVVHVSTATPDGTPAKLPFHLQAECAGKGLWAAFDTAGKVARGNGVVRSSHPDPGRWEVTFATDVSDCGYLASVGDPRTQTVPDPALVLTARGRDGNPASVHVETVPLDGDGRAGQPADVPFHLQVVCGERNVQYLVTGRRGAQQRGTATDLTSAGTGKWEVTFGRDVSKCAYLATVGDAGTQSVSPPGLAVTSSGRDRNSVHVETRNLAGTATDLPYHLRAVC